MWIEDVLILENSRPEFEVRGESLLIEFWSTVSPMVAVLRAVRKSSFLPYFPTFSIAIETYPFLPACLPKEDSG